MQVLFSLYISTVFIPPAWYDLYFMEFSFSAEMGLYNWLYCARPSLFAMVTHILYTLAAIL